MKVTVDALPKVWRNKPKIDFSYLEKYGSREKYQLPTAFTKSEFIIQKQFEARITYIYDPSKFWMVIKFRELEVFQKYLLRFYYVNGVHYKMTEDDIQVNKYCVAFVDNAYYRGVIIGYVGVHRKEPEIQVLFIDYGMIASTTSNNIYYPEEQILKVPQFAVRTGLANVCPAKAPSWSCEDVGKFYELVVDKILIVVIIKVNWLREVLEVYLSDKDDPNSQIHEILISEDYAKYCTLNATRYMGLKYPYLFPLHEALESGKLPLTIGDADFQLQVASTSILSNYYRKDPNQTKPEKTDSHDP